MHPLLNGRWVAAVVLLGSGASVFYAFSIVWLAQAAVLYVNCDTVRVGYINTIVGTSILPGPVGGVSSLGGYERHDTNAYWQVRFSAARRLPALITREQSGFRSSK